MTLGTEKNPNDIGSRQSISQEKEQPTGGLTNKQEHQMLGDAEQCWLGQPVLFRIIPSLHAR